MTEDAKDETLEKIGKEWFFKTMTKEQNYNQQ